jgi:uncharacterized phage infection (PIP) family protein YhgE
VPTAARCCATVAAMAEGGYSTSYSSIGLGDLLALLGTSNPLAGIGKTIQQLHTGAGQFLETIERFNETMDQLNQVARRVNSLLDTVEEPVKAFVPQMTRTIRTADALMDQLDAVPRDLANFVELLGDLARRLQPLGQLAESAGSMFGLRPLAALRAGGGRPAPPPPPPLPARKPAGQQAPAKKVTTKKVTTKQGTTQQGTAKNAPAKKSPGKTTVAKSAPTKKAAPRR